MKRLFSRLYWQWYYLCRGVRNVFRYAPVVWHDEDFDWAGLATVMEYKFRKMAESHKRERLVDSEKYEKELRICAEHLKRLLEDELGERGTLIYNFYNERMKGHQREVGRRIGRHLMHWWS